TVPLATGPPICGAPVGQRQNGEEYAHPLAKPLHWRPPHPVSGRSVLLRPSRMRGLPRQVGTKGWSFPIEQRDAAIDLNIRQRPLYMTNLLNLTHTTQKYSWAGRSCDRFPPRADLGAYLARNFILVSSTIGLRVSVRFRSRRR